MATYANNATRSCVLSTKCQPGYYGSNDTKSCVNICPNQLYKNDTTRRC